MVKHTNFYDYVETLIDKRVKIIANYSIIVGWLLGVCRGSGVIVSLSPPWMYIERSAFIRGVDINYIGVE